VQQKASTPIVSGQKVSDWDRMKDGRSIIAACQTVLSKISENLCENGFPATRI